MSLLLPQSTVPHRQRAVGRLPKGTSFPKDAGSGDSTLTRPRFATENLSHRRNHQWEDRLPPTTYEGAKPLGGHRTKGSQPVLLAECCPPARLVHASEKKVREMIGIRARAALGFSGSWGLGCPPDPCEKRSYGDSAGPAPSSLVRGAHQRLRQAPQAGLSQPEGAGDG